ncbi:MAG TPA: tetratricopeptide repeat protein, partial [Symbiobacteriaceae bacterium]|nr:tetratricopeptide repeat protein [Symbiobacteriaceae bacterium]
NLTDSATDVERTRNYPADRAIRILHGLVDLLAAAAERLVGAPWTIVVDGFDQAGALVQAFYSHLLRRRGKDLGLTLLIATAPGRGDEAMGRFPAACQGARFYLDLIGDMPVVLSPLEARAEALALEAEAGTDRIQREILLPAIIPAWLTSDEPQRALPWLGEALDRYVTQGLYADALPYGEMAMSLLEAHDAANLDLRWFITAKLFNIFAGLNEGPKANIAIEQFLSHTSNPWYTFQCNYYQAMLWSRYLPERDYDRAEAFLLEGLDSLQRSGMEEERKQFRGVFLKNGLALIRVRQRRMEEALALCQEGFHLMARILPDAHHLHRSVLLYNSAQVYAMIGRVDEAIEQFGGAIEMDPNYSEYYNDRGSIYLGLGRLAEAEADYRRAIELSPPYAEVWVNLGQCLRQAGREREAVEAYGRALDLEPALASARLGRAECLEGLGDLPTALLDYDELLAVSPAHVVARGNRAVLHWTMGRPDLALHDLTTAIEIAPREAELYQNRAVALVEVGRPQEARADLQT